MDWTYFINDQAHKGNEENHILTAWIGGIQAEKWENRTNEETIERVMKNLRLMFPPPYDVPEPTNFVVTRWKSDPFTRGTYHYHSIRMDTYEGQETLAWPVRDKVFFAGEATTYGMSAPNAYWSGIDAINWIFETGVLDTPLESFPEPEPILCSRSAHACRVDEDCCGRLRCMQKSLFRDAKICTSRTPIVLNDEQLQQQISLRGGK